MTEIMSDYSTLKYQIPLRPDMDALVVLIERMESDLLEAIAAEELMWAQELMWAPRCRRFTIVQGEVQHPNGALPVDK